MKRIFFWLVVLTLCGSCQPKTSDKIEAVTLLETIKSWNGNKIPEIKGQPKVTISKVVIPPKQKLPKHIHPVIVTGVLLKGELTITDDQNKQLIIRKGDVLVEVSNTIHFGKNTGNTDAEILVFYIGEENTPITTLVE